MKSDVRFGPAGIPPDYSGGSVGAVKYIHDEGLRAFELEFVRGVKMSEDTAKKVREQAENYKIKLSAHAPYWINCAAKEPQKIKNTIRNIMETVRIAHALGAGIIVFHPAFYLGRTPAQTHELVVKTLKQVEEKMKQEKITDVILGAETMGKTTQYGTVDELVQLSQEIPVVKPVIDFAHLHARCQGCIHKKEDYAKIFDALEKGLGKKAVSSFHSHFSSIEWNKGGEKRHLVLEEASEPPFKPLAKLLVENGYSGTIICETPYLDLDALKLKRMYEKEKG